jgi:hypothetical protein
VLAALAPPWKPIVRPRPTSVASALRRRWAMARAARPTRRRVQRRELAHHVVERALVSTAASTGPSVRSVVPCTWSSPSRSPSPTASPGPSVVRRTVRPSAVFSTATVPSRMSTKRRRASPSSQSVAPSGKASTVIAFDRRHTCASGRLARKAVARSRSAIGELDAGTCGTAGTARGVGVCEDGMVPRT